MSEHRLSWIALTALAAAIGVTTPSHANTGTVRVTGGALAGGVGGVQLKNDKGVVITLQGPKVGLEASANVTRVVITLDQTRSTPD